MKVQIGYVDFPGSGFSMKGVYLKDYLHGREKVVKECWLVEDEFVFITEKGEQIIVNKNQASAFCPLHPIDWLREEYKLDPEEQLKLCRARAAAAAAKGKK